MTRTLRSWRHYIYTQVVFKSGLCAARHTQRQGQGKATAQLRANKLWKRLCEISQAAVLNGYLERYR